MEEILTKIKQYGYWKIIIRPTNYKGDLVPSTDDCKELIKQSVVSLRGWNYPYIDPAGIKISGDNNIHSYCDWPEGQKYEYWRFYQTGQFVHYFAMREDLKITPEKIIEFKDEYDTKNDKFLSILSTLYSVTEIFEFAARLFSNMDTESIEIIIELHGVKNRLLVFWDTFGRSLSRAYSCDYPEGIIKINKTMAKDSLISNSNDLSLDTTIEIFKKFNWEGANKSIFIEDQKKLLERRL